MAKITLKNLSHSYLTKQNSDSDWALRDVNIDWKDGGAYALLGPSGCGKTTLLNIISGLLKPTKGDVLFNDKDVTTLNPVERDIAQIFQFPVIYDTMTVYNNLAFPLKNRGLSENEIDSKVKKNCRNARTYIDFKKQSFWFNSGWKTKNLFRKRIG